MRAYVISTENGWMGNNWDMEGKLSEAQLFPTIKAAREEAEEGWGDVIEPVEIRRVKRKRKK